MIKQKDNPMPTRRECANAIRALSIDAIEKARSGHPGAPLGMADMAETLWNHFFKHNPANPQWADRDRFVLSNGHASMLLYAVLHLSGYDISMEDIKNFRQLGSRTPGHPERNPAKGIEMTTGPLGQGIASAVGMALAEAMLGAYFNRPDFRIVDHYTYAFCGDGCLMEGVSHEACSLAGTWKLGNLIVFYDANGVSIDGKVDPWFNEDVGQRYAAYGWQVLGPLDGHDFAALDSAIKEAQNDKSRPSLIICKTHIGFGSPKTDTSASHGAPLGEEAVERTKEKLGWKDKAFEIPAEIYKAWDSREKGAATEKKWKELFEGYAKKYPDLAREFQRRMSGKLPENWTAIEAMLLKLSEKTTDSQATRVESRQCLEILVPRVPEMVGGSADLSGSVGAQTKSSIPLTPEHIGNYVFYGVREFGMGAIMNGIAIHGGFIPYAGTFLSFSDQAKNALRLSALMGLRVIWIMTHDSIGVGEDGPTHQPVEQLPSLRLIPNMAVWRPCDTVETAQAWIAAMEDAARPTSLILSRQKLPQMPHDPDQVKNISRGGYILQDCKGAPDIILISTGSEVQLAMGASVKLSEKGHKCRVVSMPCTEVFDAQDEKWKESVLPAAVECRLAIEAASSDIWRKYVGLKGEVIGMDGFGQSAPGDTLFSHYGFTVENIVLKAEKLLAKDKLK